MTHRSASSPSWVQLRADFRARRATRAARRALERELSAYTTPADLRELDAILDRHDPDEAAEVRRIVDRLRVTAR
jgi:hypothetical protein